MYKSGFPALLRSLLCLALLLGHDKVAFSETAQLSWDANTESDLTGYKVYVGTVPGIYDQTFDAGNIPSYVVTELGLGTYYFSVTAYDNGGLESGFSNEVSKSFADTTPPVISGAAVTSITTTGAVVTWITSELASSTIRYGTKTTSSATLVTIHSMTLNGLSPSTAYTLTIRGKDAAGNQAKSVRLNLTTLAVPA